MQMHFVAVAYTYLRAAPDAKPRQKLLLPCPRCEAKAKAALATEDSVWLSERKFAVIGSKMTAGAADAAIAQTGLCPILTLPVLE